MEYALIAIAAIAAFGAVSLPILVWASMRRTEALRQALNAAMTRIDVLETAVATAALEPRPQQATLASGQAPEAIAAAFDPPALVAPVAALIADARPAAAATAAFEPVAPPAEAAPLAPQAEAAVQSGAVVMLLAPLAVAAAAAALAGGASGAIPATAGAGLAGAAGAAAIAAAEALRRRAPLQPAVGEVLVGVGLVLIVLAARYAAAPFAVAPPAASYAACVACAAACFFLSGRYGAALSYIGAAIACATPALFPLADFPVAAHCVVIIAATTAAMIDSRRHATPPLAWLTVGGAIAWGGVFAWIGGDALHVATVGGFAAALAALGLGYASDAARGIAPFPRPWAAAWREPLIVAHIESVAASAMILATLARNGESGGAIVFSAIALMTLSAAASAWRPALTLTPFIAGLAAAAALLIWPSGPTAAPNLITAAAALALCASCAGAFLQWRQPETPAGAALASLMPIAALAAARIHLGAFGQEEVWIGVAAAVTLLNALAAWRATRTDAATFWIAGAACGAAIAAWIATPPALALLTLSCTVIGLAIVDAVIDQRGLRLAAGLVSGAALAQLLFANAAAEAQVAAFGWSSPATPLIAFTATCFAVASSVFAYRADRKQALAPQGLMMAAITLACAAVALWVRDAWREAQAAAPVVTLEEIGLYAGALLLAAIAFAWRFGSRATPLPFFAEALMAVGAAALSLFGAGLVCNPWWGVAPATVYGGPGLNSLLAGFAIPAIGFFAYAQLRAAQGYRERAALAASVGALLALLNVLLEIRRLFQGADMAIAATAPLEGWAITLALLGFAGAVLAAGFEMADRRVRALALAIALAALVKSAVFDVGALSGFGAVAVLALLVALGGALVIAFRRYAWSVDGQRVIMIADPNLMPPR
ncbi:MAG: DUF2339 domain-containing protein [Hyphomonadaceae bacterium]|nr:DUF2339 domain-containing protein [Hyphomonadaceae bacterium]